MFLARTDEQRRFEGALAEIGTAPPQEGASQVFLLHGLGGMGKTELCDRFKAIAEGQLDSTRDNKGRYLVVSVNWENEREHHAPAAADPAGTRPSEVFTVLYDAVMSNKRVQTSKRLKKQAVRAFEPYGQVVEQIQKSQLDESRLADRADGENLAAALLKMAGRAGDAAAGNPLPSTAAEGITQVSGAVRRSRKGSVDTELIQARMRPDETLTREFGRGLLELSKRCPIVFIVDTYEIVLSCGSWLRQVMRESGKRVLWVMAARLEPEDEAPHRGELASFKREIPEDSLRVIAMTSFERETIAADLAQRGVPDADDSSTLDAVASLTRGIPLAVSIVAGMLAQGQPIEEISRAVTDKGDATKLVRELTERYLLHARLDPSLQADIPLLSGLALLYSDQADPDVIGALWDQKDSVAATLEDLARRHDFVLTGSRRLHQEVRETLRQYLLDEFRRADLRGANGRAGEVALAKAHACARDSATEGCLASEEWRAATATFVWHSFWESNEKGLEALCDVFPAAVLLERTFAHELVSLAHFFNDTLSVEQESLLRGLASLLSFGSFLDTWLAKRQEAMLSGAVRNPLPPGSEVTTDTDRRFALETLENAVERSVIMPSAPPPGAIVQLLIAKSCARTDTKSALEALRAAAESMPVNDERLAKLMAETGRELADLLNSSRDGTSPSADCLRAARLRAKYAPDSPGALFGLGWNHAVLRERSESIAAYEELVRRFGEDDEIETRRLLSSAFYNIGVEQSALGNHKEELDAYEEVIERFSGEDDRRLNREVAKAMLSKGTSLEPSDPELAIEVYDKLCDSFGDSRELDPRRFVSEAIFAKAELIARLHGGEAELAAYDDAIERLDGDSAPLARTLLAKSLFNKGNALRLADRDDEASLAFDRLIARFRDDDEVKIRWVVSRGLLKRFDLLRAGGETPDSSGIEEVTEPLLAADPPRPDVLGEYALFLTDELEAQDRAQTVFERALEADPESVFNLSNFARLLFEQGQTERACELVDRALASEQEVPEPVRLEVNFYLLATGPSDRHDAGLAEVRRLLETGVRSYPWRFDRILDRASAQGQADLAWLGLLADAINDEAPLEKLDGWAAWQRGG